MKEKGHLGIGAEGSVTILDLDPNNYTGADVKKAFTNAAYTIKEGAVVARAGIVEASGLGNTYWTDPGEPKKYDEVVERIKDEWSKRYTISYNNYAVFDKYIPHQKVVNVHS